MEFIITSVCLKIFIWPRDTGDARIHHCFNLCPGQCFFMAAHYRHLVYMAKCMKVSHFFFFFFKQVNSALISSQLFVVSGTMYPSQGLRTVAVSVAC